MARRDGTGFDPVPASVPPELAADQADREESDIAVAKSSRLKEKIAGLRRQMQALKVMEQIVPDAPDRQVSLTDPDSRLKRGVFRGIVDLQAAINRFLAETNGRRIGHNLSKTLV